MRRSHRDKVYARKLKRRGRLITRALEHLLLTESIERDPFVPTKPPHALVYDGVVQLAPESVLDDLFS